LILTKDVLAPLYASALDAIANIDTVGEFWWGSIRQTSWVREQQSERFVLAPFFLLLGSYLSFPLYWLLWSSVLKQARRDGERSPSPACKQRLVGIQSDVVTSILMLERQYSQVMEKLLV
jgi:hypothetical protein